MDEQALRSEAQRLLACTSLYEGHLENRLRRHEEEGHRPLLELRLALRRRHVAARVSWSRRVGLAIAAVALAWGLLETIRWKKATLPAVVRIVAPLRASASAPVEWSS